MAVDGAKVKFYLKLRPKVGPFSRLTGQNWISTRLTGQNSNYRKKWSSFLPYFWIFRRLAWFWPQIMLKLLTQKLCLMCDFGLSFGSKMALDGANSNSAPSGVKLPQIMNIIGRKIQPIFTSKTNFAPSGVIFSPKNAGVFEFLWGKVEKIRTRSTFCQNYGQLSKSGAKIIGGRDLPPPNFETPDYLKITPKFRPKNRLEKVPRKKARNSWFLKIRVFSALKSRIKIGHFSTYRYLYESFLKNWNLSFSSAETKENRQFPKSWN